MTHHDSLVVVCGDMRCGGGSKNHQHKSQQFVGGRMWQRHEEYPPMCHGDMMVVVGGGCRCSGGNTFLSPPIVHMDSTQITVFGKDYLWVCVGLGLGFF